LLLRLANLPNYALDRVSLVLLSQNATDDWG
jgi:hypothetical protein